MLYENYIQERRDEPMLYYCGVDENLTPGIQYGPVIRDVYVVECCTGGYGAVIINGTEFPVQGGDCYILLPGDTVTHVAADEDPRYGVWCVIDGLQVARTIAGLGITSKNPFLANVVLSEIAAPIEEMVAMRRENYPGIDMRRTACVYNLLAALVRHTPTVADKNTWIQRAIGVIEARYDKPLSVGDLAAEVGLERSYFSTLFKAQTGLSPHAYITSLRIRKACTLMKEGHHPIAEAAASVGLDPKNFSRLFKKETGKTPREYLMP